LLGQPLAHVLFTVTAAARAMALEYPIASFSMVEWDAWRA
jgi:hypothetical protein